MNMILTLPDIWAAAMEERRAELRMRSRQELVRWCISEQLKLGKPVRLGPDTSGWPRQDRHVTLCHHCQAGDHTKHRGPRPEIVVEGQGLRDDHVIERWICHCAECGYVAPAAGTDGRPAVTA